MNCHHLKGLIFFSLQLIAVTCSSQAIDNTATFRNINSKSYIRLHYDNDFFAATDEYYTQGINLELVLPSLKRFPISKILIHRKYNSLQYGIALVHEGYTPSSIRHEEIILDDRPFAANFCFNTFLISVDSLKHKRMTSAVSIGVIGPLAGGADMQKSIHRWLNNIAPLGWQNQIKNDVVVNYQVCAEELLVSLHHMFSVNTETNIRLGTLSDKAGVGFTAMLGYFDSPFRAVNNKIKKFQLYFYDQPMMSFIGYDATLQGGLFDKNSPYTIADDQISRVTFQNDFGVVIRIKKIYLEYSHAFLSKEFETGTTHSWGGIRIGCAF